MRRFVILAASALLAGLLCRPAAGAPTLQPVQAPDKALHFLLGASCALLVSAVAAPALAELPQPDLRYALQVSSAGLGAACFAGIVKELLDIAGFGDPEWLDLLATVGGGLAASAIVFAAGASNPNAPRLAPVYASFGAILALPPAADLFRRLSSRRSSASSE
jgi:hypothetical protein